MRIRIKNIGALRQAEFELGDLTIICGGNNTGKTYATYTLFGFLSFWHEAFYVDVPKDQIDRLLSDGNVELKINDYLSNASEIVAKACSLFNKRLPSVFASSSKYFEESELTVDMENRRLTPMESYNQTMGAPKAQLFTISKQPNRDTVDISLLVEKDKVKVPSDFIRRIVGDALKEIIFGGVFPRPFIASAERTGAAIFRKELNLARNRLLEEIGAKDQEIDPFEILTKDYQDYALPVKRNVDFTRKLETISKKESLISRNHPHILEEFSQISGGEYRVTKNEELYYIPLGKRLKLTMDESSSSVRSLLDIGFYLKHVAEPGDLLIIDEPELNLHPENQRRIARLLARLVNVGIKVFVTTHSDYIIKELNTLIMLNHDKPHLKEIAQQEGYSEKELLVADQVRVFVAEEACVQVDGAKKKIKCQTLTPADIDPELGIEARSFDKSIEQMNQIQEAIVWGGI